MKGRSWFGVFLGEVEWRGVGICGGLFVNYTNKGVSSVVTSFLTSWSMVLVQVASSHL